MISKVLFTSEFPDIPEKIWQRSRGRRRKAIAKLCAFQANAINLKFMKEIRAILIEII